MAQRPSSAGPFEYTVSYDGNGSTDGEVPQSSGPYASEDWVTVDQNRGANALVKAGCMFANWNEAPDGSLRACGGTGDPQIQIIFADITLYAQWYTTAGLTPDQQGNAGWTAHYKFWYDSSRQKTATNPNGVEPDRTNALIAACEADFAILQQWFGPTKFQFPVFVPVNVLVANLDGGAEWDTTTSYCTLKPNDTFHRREPADQVTYLRYLLVQEVTEMFMLAQGRGWFPLLGQGYNEGSAGEGLSRFLGMQFLLATGSPLRVAVGYDVADQWLNSALHPVVSEFDYGPRRNYVDLTLPWDATPGPATGCAVLFLYYLLDQLNFDIPAIVAAAAPTLSGVYRNLTADRDSPFPAFRALLDLAFPPDTTAAIPGLNPDNPWPLAYQPPRPLLMAQTGQNGLTSIANLVSVNSSGSVAFVGYGDGISGLFVADGTFAPDGQTPPRNINPGTSANSDRVFSEYVQINDGGDVLAADQVDGVSFVRAWDSASPDQYRILARGGQGGPVQAVMGPVSGSRSGTATNSGPVVFPAVISTVPPPRIGAATFLATPVTTTPTKAPVTGAVTPRISDTGRIVVSGGWRPNSPILVYGDVTQDPVTITDMSSDFSATGHSPGISADGQIVAFYGELTPAGAATHGIPAGPGIFAAIWINEQWTIHRVAGTGGDDPAALHPDAPIGVNSVRMFVYLGFDADGNTAVYTSRLSYFSVDPARLRFGPVAPPANLATTGWSLVLANGLALEVLAEVNIYDPINERGDVAFWAQTVHAEQAVILLPRGSGSDYRDPDHETYINAYAAGARSAPYPRGLPRALSDGRRGGDACGTAGLIMLMNSLQYATDPLLDVVRWPLMGVYTATADQKVGDPAAPPDGNNFNWYKGRSFARHQGWRSARVLLDKNSGQAAIDAQLAAHVPVLVSTRFGTGPNWSKGHVVLLLSKTPGAKPGTGFYVVDDPAGYVTATGTGGYGHYGPDQCGEHVKYPEALVAQALLYPDGSARPALVLNPAPGTDPDVLMIIGRFDGPGPPPYQFWLQDTAGRQAGWLPGGTPVTDIPDSDAAVAPVVASDPSAVPEVPPDPARWSYVVSVTQPADGLTVFVAGQMQAGFALETLRFTDAGVIRSVTTGTVAAGATQQVTLTAPATYQLTLSAGPGGTAAVFPVPGPYPEGTEVTVTATPDPGYVLSGWTVDGAAGDSAQPLMLVMDADHTAAASFTAVTVASVTVTPAVASVPPGTSAAFQAAVTYSDGSTADLTASATWSASDPATASFSAPGQCGARVPGQVTITAAVAGVTATAALTVTGTPVLVSIAVSPAARSLAAGASVQLTATGTWSDGSTADVTGTAEWSSNATTVTVGLAGLVTAGPVPGSTASVSAFIGTASGSAAVTVIAPPVLTAIEVIPFGAGRQQFVAIGTYSDGSTSDITDGVTWASSNGQIAGVTGAGLATGVAAGQVTIGATAVGISGSGGLQAGPPSLVAIMISPGGAAVTAGSAVELTATGVMSDGTTRDLTATVGWVSQNYLTATIGSTGIANGSQPGSTLITATQAGVSASVTLTVTSVPALQAVAVTPARPVIAAGGTMTFGATGLYDDGSTRDLTATAIWSSGTKAVATVEPGGAASGAASGITQITAAAAGFAGAASLVVTAVPVLWSIAVTPAAPSVPVGETIQFTATGTYTDGSTRDVTGTATWASANTGVATVARAGGLATPAAQGTTSIIATDGAVSGAASLIVPPPLTTVTWTGQVSTSWQDAGNWSGGQVPGPCNDVIIAGPAGLVVTYTSATSSIHSLSCQNDLAMTGGSLTLGASSVIAGALTLDGAAELGYGADVLVAGLFTCTYGQLSGPGTIAAASRLVLSGESLRLTGGTLVNTGTAIWSSGNIGLEQDAAIVNEPGAVFEVRFDPAFLTYQGTDVATFTNNGTFHKSAGTGTASLTAITFHNAGTIELDSGALSFEPNPSLPGSTGIWTGTVTGADGTTLTFAGPHHLRESSVLTASAVVFNGGPVTIAGRYDVAIGTSTTTADPAVSFTGGATVASTGAVTVDSGTIGFGTGTPVTVPSLTLSTNGELTGPDDVLVNGMLTVTSGTLSGPGTVTASSGLTISAAGAQLQVSGCALVNTGYATWTGGNISLGSGGTIENRAGARFEVLIDQFTQLNAFILNTAGPGPAALINAGMFHVPSVAGTGTVRVQSVALDNTGFIQLDGGTLFLQPDSARPAVWSRTFTGGPGSTLVLAGPHDLQASSSVTGPAVQFASPFGPVTIAGSYDVTVSTSTTTASPVVRFTRGANVVSTGEVTIDSGMISFGTGTETALILPSLTLSGGGALAGPDSVTVSGMLAVTGGGVLAGPGTVTAASYLSISGHEEFLISGCTLVNTGAATWSGGPVNADNGAVFANTATGTFEVTCDSLFYWCGGGPDGCSPIGGQPVFQNAGTFVKSAGPGITDFRGLPDLGGMDVSFVNTGTVEVRTGQVAFGRTYTQTAGFLLLNGGDISALGTLDLQAGALSGTGTVTANLQSAAALALGPGIGTLTIAGDYTQLAAGQLTIRLGGLSAGMQYDQLIVSGTASLAGTLTLVLASGFTPAAGAVFTVMTYGSETGSLAVAGGGQPYTGSYTATALDITASGSSG